MFLKQKVVQGIDPNQIRGLGFDATCSLVVLDKQFHPLPVNHEGKTIPFPLVVGDWLGQTWPIKSKGQVGYDVTSLLPLKVRFRSGA